jgi:hypothetical protein
VRTYPLKNDENGWQFGFEVDSVFLTLRRIVNLLSSVEGISNLRRRRLFDLTNQYHIEFDFSGDSFVVLEPFGDNSRYWIVPREPNRTRKDISAIEKVFIEYQPPFLVKMLGDLITLNLQRLFRRNR